MYNIIVHKYYVHVAVTCSLNVLLTKQFFKMLTRQLTNHSIHRTHGETSAGQLTDSDFSSILKLVSLIIFMNACTVKHLFTL